MKSNTFKYSLIAVGVTAALGITTTAMAATSVSSDTTVDIRNVATASYSVGTVAQTPVTSNTVTVRVSEKLSFSLVSNNPDGNSPDDSNVNEEVAPNGFAVFQHTLTNTGNRSDSYTLKLENVTGDDTDYDLTASASTVSYSIYNEGQVPGAGVTPVSSESGIPVSTANNQTITLEKGQFIKFTINAKTNGNKGGNKQNLKLSATSTLIPATIPTKTLVNTDDSVTKLPTFSIIKTFNKALDLNNDNDTSTYTIVVKNPTTTYSANATDITITDNLPTGLLIASALTTNSIVVAGNATKGTLSQTSKGFELTGVNIPTSGSITINFTVKKDPAAALANNALNHVKVTDDLDNIPATDNTLIDSTDSTVENVSRFYLVDDTDFTNGTVATGNDGNDSTQPFTTIKRNLTLTNPTTKEIAPSTSTTDAVGQVTHQTIITNTGKDIEGKDNQLTFTITDSNKSNAVNLVPNSVTIVYDPDGPAGPLVPQTAISIAPTVVNGVNTYNITSKLTAGLAPNSTVTINYNVSSSNAPLFTPENSTTATTESTVVTVTAAGTGAPTVPSITDTTNVKGLTLVKSQGLDANCDNVVDTTFSSSSDPLAALPGQCVIYQIAAFNNSSAAPLGFSITGLTISDLLSNFSDKADYRDGTAATTVTANSTINTQAAINGNAISTNISTLAPQGTGTMKFAVKIKNNRTVAP
ncbi:hypothetical protein [Psychrobacter sp. Pi2-51]|uniref:hypothetical protein n=1 Tax=Psychrobacter sp. Pi2-51 TaxID=2774132 RepID=UPI001917F2B4|nr:hypothetical protein [Psychrobacter sp. Pi2-51]